MLVAGDEETGLALDGHVANDRAAAAGLLEESVEDRAARLREHEPGPRRIAVDDRHQAVRPDEDRVRLAAEVEHLEAGHGARPPRGSRARRSRAAAPGRPAACRPARPSRRGCGRSRGRRCARPARARARRRARPAGSRSRARAAAAAGGEPAARSKARLELRRLGPGDLVSERAEAELELRHRVSSSCSRSRPRAREVRDLTVPRRSDSTSPVSSSPRSRR